MKYIVFSSLYLALLFLISTFIFDPMYLYYEFPWLDIPMHFLGGFGVAALVISIALYFNKKVVFTHILIAFFIVALVWELYEYLQDVVAIQAWNGWSDTISDTVNGLLGTVFAYLLVRK